jgi:hypothetical protein
MIVEQITNQDGGTALSVSECGIWMESSNIALHHAFETSVDLEWLIVRLNELYVNTREAEKNEREKAELREMDRRKEKSPVSLEDAMSKFSAMRQMLGGD